MFEFIKWIIITAFPTYGALVSVLKITEVEKYREENPTSLPALAHNWLLRPWTRTNNQPFSPEHLELATEQCSTFSTQSFNLHPTYVIYFSPGRIRLPSNSGFVFFLVIVDLIFIGTSISDIAKFGITLSSVYSVLVSIAIGLILIYLYALVSGQVLRRTIMYIESDSVYVLDDWGERRLKLDGILQFSVERQKTWFFRSITYVWYENIKGEKTRLIYCPTFLEKYALKESPEVLVSSINQALMATQKKDDY